LFSLGLRPGPFLKTFLFAHWGGVYLTDKVFKGHAAHAFFALPGRFSPLGESLFFCARKKKVTKKKRRPAGLSASLATLLGLSSSAPTSEGRGTLCKTWSVSAVPFEAASKHTPHSQPSWGFPHLPPSARVAEHCAKFGTCQQQLLKPTACFQQAAI